MENLFSRRNSYDRNNRRTVYKKILVAIFQYYDILKNLLRTAFKKESHHLLRYKVFEADCVTSESKQHKFKIRSSQLYVKKKY
jgi:hypothetical protein